MSKNIIIVILVIFVVLLSRSLIRLENYRYASVVGVCSEFNPNNPNQLLEWQNCLNKAQTRTHPLWHIFYALKE